MKRCSHALVALTLASALVAGSAFAGSQLLYKCIDGGRTVYQQQACPVSMADAPSSAGNAASAPAPTPTHKVKSAAPAASTAPATPR